VSAPRTSLPFADRLSGRRTTVSAASQAPAGLPGDPGRALVQPPGARPDAGPRTYSPLATRRAHDLPEASAQSDASGGDAGDGRRRRVSEAHSFAVLGFRAWLSRSSRHAASGQSPRSATRRLCRMAASTAAAPPQVAAKRLNRACRPAGQGLRRCPGHPPDGSRTEDDDHARPAAASGVIAGIRSCLLNRTQEYGLPTSALPAIVSFEIATVRGHDLSRLPGSRSPTPSTTARPAHEAGIVPWVPAFVRD
jgi:hypothetical protein